MSADIVTDGAEVLLKTFADQWLTIVKAPTLKPSSYDKLENVLQRQIYPHIGDLSLEQIDEHVIQVNIINQLKNSGYSHTTIKLAHAALKQVLDYAVIRKRIKYNPVHNIKVPRQVLFETKEKKAFSEDERKRFIDACYATDSRGKRCCYYGGFYVLMLATGMRMGEASVLKWSDVNIPERYLTVSHTMIYVKDRSDDKGKKILVDQNSTKSGKTRKVYLSDLAIEALEDLKEQIEYDPNGYVLHTSKGTFLFPSDLQKRFYNILHRAGIEPCGLHTLRHSYASLMIGSGVPITVVSSMLGHSNIAMTMKVYTHLLQETQFEAMAIMKNIK
jgi:integrase